jgi:hypothetical protein
VLGCATVGPGCVWIGADALEFRASARAESLLSADRTGIAAREPRGFVVKGVVVAVIAFDEAWALEVTQDACKDRGE